MSRPRTAFAVAAIGIAVYSAMDAVMKGLSIASGAYAAVLWRSLARFDGLPDDTRVYSGHDYVLSNARFARAAEPDNARLAARMDEAERARAEGRFLVPTTLGDERATNPFLRAGEPALARAVNLSPGTEAVHVFTALRAWKNKF